MSDKIYYCNCEECKFAKCIRSGDGWNEPVSIEFDCNLGEQLDSDAEYTDCEDDPICPWFELGQYWDASDYEEHFDPYYDDWEDYDEDWEDNEDD